MKSKQYYVYINTNKPNQVLYTGVTNGLFNRNDQHKRKVRKNSFTAKYNINKLVYYEIYESPQDAIAREKEIKGWTRKKKLVLIKRMNHGWKDLEKVAYEELNKRNNM
jgi:putative endonuclease